MAQPLFLQSQMQEKIWGGQRLKTQFGYSIPSATTGEYWAISAHPNGPSIIENGPLAGRSLAQVYSQHQELFGQEGLPVFPLLTKILDANDWLSVQVHPDDNYGLKHEGELGKTECWYILEAEEGAEIIYGHTAKSKEELAQAFDKKNWDGLLQKLPVKAGDFFYVPSGTLHAIGPGILILETQQSSDTTYRVYDFDRLDDQGNKRDLHLEQALDVTTIGQPQNSRPVINHLDNLTLTTLTSNDFFSVQKWEIKGPVSVSQSAPYSLVSVIDGQGEVTLDGQTYPLKKGQHFILTTDCQNWTYQGQMSLIISHP